MTITEDGKKVALEAFQTALETVDRRNGRCRDCADNDGTCGSNGVDFCDPDKDRKAKMLALLPFEELITDALSTTPPPVDGELAEACEILSTEEIKLTSRQQNAIDVLIQAATSQQSRKRALHPSMLSAEDLAAIAKAEVPEEATSQQARDEKFLYWDTRDMAEGYNSPRDCCDGAEIGEPIRLQKAKVLPDVWGMWSDSRNFNVYNSEDEALAAKNIIRLKDGGGE